jgi:hypothetical protein
MIPVTAITTFLATELVFAARGVRRCPAEVTFVPVARVAVVATAQS